MRGGELAEYGRGSGELERTAVERGGGFVVLGEFNGVAGPEDVA